MEHTYSWLQAAMANQGLTGDALNFAETSAARYGSFSSQASVGSAASMYGSGQGVNYPVSSVESSPRCSTAQWSYVGSDSSSSKGPLERLGFKINLLGEKKTRDGQAPKRRGPKPDSKPALTRRQELNRQAQRTHRERKEMYIKALEQEVLRLKELYESSNKERDAYIEENRRLKELLSAHGIQYAASQYGDSSTSFGGSPAHGSVSTGYTSPPAIADLGKTQLLDQTSGQMAGQQYQPVTSGLDYDQIGIDFVLTLENPCMDHMQFLMVRSQDSDGEISGHALMATCPPASHIEEHPDEKYPHKLPDLGMPELVKLLDLSNRLPLDGEITPIMAWAGIRGHAEFDRLSQKDLEAIKEDLKGKVRCYGFGAVLEEFEVRDAITNVLAAMNEAGLVTDS